MPEAGIRTAVKKSFERYQECLLKHWHLSAGMADI